ncbi:iron-containing alcohol dehydrogenase [Brevibacillus sp. H7]|uniref:iron-containing alcohol dehydrogenase n=1 Tax=Brevibacillus sp. H7 TaxID=3349138 RepID=UPI0037FA7869
MRSCMEFRMPQTILYGRGSFSKAGEQAGRFGKKALLISDRVMEELGNTEECLHLMKQAGVDHAAYLHVNTEPTDVYVEEALRLFVDEKCDVIVALGGGSCIDAAKAVALVAANGGYIGDYMGGKTPVEREPIPLIAVPTTAGTGSEATDVTVITNTADDVKMMIKHPALLPSVAIVDPLLTMSSPPSVTAATGVDALCHAIEAYISRRAQPLTDTLALSAIELISRNLRKAYANGNDLDAREQMALASMKAGAAFSNSSVCLVHGMSRPIGAVFHVPHGVSNAMLLPAVLAYTRDSAMERLAVIGRLMKPDGQGLSHEEWADVAIAEAKRLCRDLHIPTVKTWGIDKAKWDEKVQKMAADALASGSPGNHPRVPSHDEIVRLYDICYHYDFHAIESVVE